MKKSYELKASITSDISAAVACLILLLTLIYPFIFSGGLYVVFSEWDFSIILWFVLIGICGIFLMAMMITYLKSAIKEKRQLNDYIKNMEEELFELKEQNKEKEDKDKTHN